MDIESTMTNERNDGIFTDFLSRQPISDQRNFTFDIDRFRAVDSEAAQQVIKDPSKHYVIIKKFLQERSRNSDMGDGLKFKKNNLFGKSQRYNIKIDGNLGANFVTPRGLNSRLANQLVGIQGIITKMEIYQSYLEKSVHYCQATKSFENKSYPDSFNPEKDTQLNLGRLILQKDAQGNVLEFQFGLSTFKDTQMVVIQQLPEMAPPGLLPMSVQVVLQGQLVNSVKPGDRVQMIGIYKLVAGMSTKQKGIFRPYFICLSIKPLNMISSLVKKPSKTDLQNEQIYELFSRSVAPSVWGHECVKKAILLMLVGGVEKVLENNTHLRGDINLLMIGDPGTAKSQMLRWVLSSVDVSVGTTGSGASGVGLTAAIVSDKLTGQKTLQAGAMVLADRGVVCIDEFDKMNETDRVAVHEVMQQQTVTIAKAGLHCSLNARCAVIAAANPIYGQYLTSMAPTKNIGMSDSLLSRFDLIFIIKDAKSKQYDSQIAQKVCKNHRLAPQLNDFLNQYMDQQNYIISPIEQRRVDQDSIYEKNNVYKSQGQLNIVTQSFFKQYINDVKLNIVPQLTDQSVKLCAALWTLLRQKDANQNQGGQTKVLPVTIRTHESLIRLATAHAKLLKRSTVEAENVIEAFKLFCYCNHGGEHNLFSDLQDILKEYDIDYDMTKMHKKKNFLREKIYQQKEQMKIKNEIEEQIESKLDKLKLKQSQKQVNEALQKQKSDIQFTKSEKTFVYKKLSDMIRKKKGNQKWLMFKDLSDQVKSEIKNSVKLDFILKDLQQDNKIGLENGKIFII